MKSLIRILIPRQLLLLLVLATGLLNHVILIPNLLTASGRDSWIGVIAAFPISLIFLFLIYYVVKNSPPEGFFSMVKQRMGKWLYRLLIIPVIIFLFSSAYVTLKDLIIWLNAYFLADFSLLVITGVITVSCLLVTMAGIKHIAIASGFILPLVILLGIMIAAINTSVKDPSLLLPILSDGWSPVLKGIIYTLSGLLEVYIVILLQPFSQESFKFRQLVILLVILTGLILGPLSASIMEFGPVESIKFRYPAYEQWRILSVGEYINHMDFFALYQWLSGALVRAGLFMYLLGVYFTKELKHYRLKPRIVVVSYALLFAAVIFVKLDLYYFSKFIYRYYLPGCLLFFVTYILLSALLLFMFNRRVEQDVQNIQG
ncbi:endospore germination permease [Rossellomorea aquimaris]|uniref:GerAB/ArcD/ProY family transporter n=1 Tax=Rossellomorea aquimaris TaxID=189382 RepID=A0A5D4T9Y2_9BACI|nr:endospore germination permease [Rossellomorea aquimaris]TYS72523.1 GerAB/ArcD/ProY family transporter [Rossellomorea aquimaris]